MRPALRNLTSGQAINHSDINALRRWCLNAYNIRHLEIAPNADNPTTKIDVKVDLAAMRSVGGEVAIKSEAATPAISLTLDTGQTGVGGLDTGKLGSGGLYAVYLAARAEDDDGLVGQVGVIASSNWQGPALPAGWTHKRLIGCIPTSSDSGESTIKPFTQVDERFLYHEAQYAVTWSNVSEAIALTPLELSGWMPPVCEEVLIDGQIFGGTAPFNLSIFEHSSGQPIIDLNPGTADFGHESAWMFAPAQVVDYSVSLTNAISGNIAVLGFRMPINQEF